MTAYRIDRVVTRGTFSLEGRDHDVENNIWLVGDGDEVLVIDAAHDHLPILDAIAGRSVVAVLCTHGHNDHINAAVPLADAVEAPVWLHPDDTALWEVVYPDRPFDADLQDRQVVEVGGRRLDVFHTPGHSPGGCSVYDDAGRVLFSGDTLFKGGPGATGNALASFDTILESITTRLLTLPPETVVHTGHGDDTTVGDEAPHVEEWRARGH